MFLMEKGNPIKVQTKVSSYIWAQMGQPDPERIEP